MRFESIDIDFYNGRLDVLDALAQSAPEYVASELLHLARMLLRESSPMLDLTSLETELSRATNLDTGALATACDVLEALSLLPIQLTKAVQLKPSEALARVRAATTVLTENQSTMHRNAAWFNVEFEIDGPLMQALMCAVLANANLEEITAVAVSKLESLSEGRLTQLWAGVQHEFSTDRARTHFDPGSRVIGANFLDLTDAASLRRKIADYIFTIKPALIAELVTQGHDSYPTDALGPASMLAMNASAPQFDHDRLREDLVRRIAGMVATLGKLPAPPNFSSALGLSSFSKLLRGTEVQDVAATIPAQAKLELLVRLAVGEVRTFLVFLKRVGAEAPPLTGLLTRFKLGFEVSLPESRNDVGPEKLLQKRLCRFLLEHGQYAEGTTFGAFETDLIALSRAAALIIEVKVYKDSKPPTLRSLQANLAQLQDYMDKRPVRPQGALVVFNLSPTLVVAPNRWLRGRYWISIINLGNQTGSKRRKTLVLDEGVGAELLVSFNNG